MPIRTPARGTTAQAPQFRFSANFDPAAEQQLRLAAEERSKHARQATDRGIARADEFARSLAQSAANMLQAAYTEAGFDIPVSYRKNGRFYTIAVTGDASAQKWARMLETGYGARDLRDTLPTARRKRAVKITRTRMTKEGPKEYRRGGKEADPGWYIVVPIVRGQVKQSNGKITFQRRLKGGMSEEEAAIGKQNAAELAELAGRLKGTDVVQNHAFETTTYRTGPGMLGPAMARDMLTTTQAQYEGGISAKQRKLALGDGPSRTITSTEGGRLQIKRNRKFKQEQAEYDAAQQALEYDEKRRRLLERMGVPDAVVRSLEPAPAWMVEQANEDGALGELANTALKKHVQYKGQVVSFRRISTREGKGSKGFMVPGRPGRHFMAEAMGWMKRELQDEISRQSRRSRLTIEQQAYLEMLRSMAN